MMGFIIFILICVILFTSAKILETSIQENQKNKIEENINKFEKTKYKNLNE